MLEKLPVSISLGLWTTLLVYLVSIPLGIAKAVRDGSRFDVWTSAVVIVGYAIPSFLFAVLLVVLFAGGSFLSWFPLRGLVSDDWPSLSWPARIAGLPLAHRAAGDRAGDRRLRRAHHADQELVPRGDRQAVRVTARAKGLSRAPRALRPRVPQRDADRDRRLPGRVRRHPVHRRAADRGDLLARRPRPARLRGGDQPRLPDHVRHAVHLHADRPGAEPGDATSPTRWSTRASTSSEPRGAVDRWRLSPAHPAPARATSARNRRGFWSLWIFLALFGVELVRRAHRQRPAAPGALRRAASTCPSSSPYPETTFGGELADRGRLPRPRVQRADRGARAGCCGRRSATATTRSTATSPRPAPAPPVARATGSAPTTRAATSLARLIWLPHLGAVRSGPDARAARSSAWPPARCRATSAGWADLLFQRFIEIWSGLPVLYLLIILASLVEPNFWWLLGLMLLFSWMALVERGARRVPARAQLRLRARGARARRRATSRSCAATCCPTPWSRR